MAKKTAQAFINQYNGTVVDYDGVYGAQCVDAFKIFCAWLGVPVRPTKTGWADGYWTYRIDYSAYVKYITDTSKFEAGDWLFWKYGSASCPYSHVGMFVSYAGNGYANIFSENQGGNGGFRTVKLKLDVLGGFRFNKLEREATPAVTPSSSTKASGVATKFNNSYAKTYYATDALNCRDAGSTTAKILVTVPKGTKVTCYGYYTPYNGVNFLYAQALVNGVLYTGFFSEQYLSTSASGSAAPKKSNETIAKEVIDGKWGVGEDRKKRLTAAGYDYAAIQAIVNKLVAKPAKKSNETIAKEVMAGKWGNGADRKRRLEAAGYNYAAVQAIVNKLAGGSSGKALRVGSRIRIRNGAMQYGKNVGFASQVYRNVYTVSEIYGNRVVFKSGNTVIGAVAASNCIVQ